MVIGIQGERYSYHEQAAYTYFGDTVSLRHGQSFRELFEWLASGSIDIAVCAVENTIYGGISDVYDLLAAYNSFWIGGEVLVPINHCLAAVDGATIQDITDVYSHPVALGQCKSFLHGSLPTAAKHEWSDTAAAAHFVAKKAEKHRGVICSEPAANGNKLQILRTAIADSSHNATRFLILYPKARQAKKANKSSIVLDLAHQPGALYDTLGAFKQAALNLSMIVSRPIPDHPWQYRFFLDVDAGAHEPHLQLAIEALKRQKIHLHILGSYQTAKNV